MARGLPDIDSLANYGGALANYSRVTDPTTDEDAAYRNLYAQNVAMMTHTAGRALCSFLGHATTPADPGSSFVHDALWGTEPADKPVVTHFAAGQYDLTWTATVDDELGVTHTVNFRRAMAQVEPTADDLLKHAVAKVTGPHTVRVFTYLANGTADNIAGELITCVVW